MRMNIEIDDHLMAEVLALTGLKTKRAAVEFGLKTLLSTKRQGAIKRLRGSIAWDGDLDAKRRDR